MSLPLKRNAKLVVRLYKQGASQKTLLKYGMKVSSLSFFVCPPSLSLFINKYSYVLCLGTSDAFFNEMQMARL